MNAIRGVLGVVGGFAAGYAVASVWLLTDRDVGIGVAVSAACVIVWGFIRAVQADRERDKVLKAAYRDAVRQDRLRDTRDRTPSWLTENNWTERNAS